MVKIKYECEYCGKQGESLEEMTAHEADILPHPYPINSVYRSGDRIAVVVEWKIDADHIEQRLVEEFELTDDSYRCVGQKPLEYGEFEELTDDEFKKAQNNLALVNLTKGKL